MLQKVVDTKKRKVYGRNMETDRLTFDAAAWKQTRTTENMTVLQPVEETGVPAIWFVREVGRLLPDSNGDGVATILRQLSPEGKFMLNLTRKELIAFSLVMALAGLLLAAGVVRSLDYERDCDTNADLAAQYRAVSYHAQVCR